MQKNETKKKQKKMKKNERRSGWRENHLRAGKIGEVESREKKRGKFPAYFPSTSKKIPFSGKFQKSGRAFFFYATPIAHDTIYHAITQSAKRELHVTR